jgi:acyl-homoserine-lactone acylase
MSHFPCFLVALLLICIGPLHAAPGNVTIYRDAWGVPHIYGDSEEAAAYGEGYAQAQDRLDDILTLYAIVQGTAARAFGPAWVQKDYEARLARHNELSREQYPSLTPRVRRIIEFYTRGLLDYIRENPGSKPEWAPMPKPYHVVALYRAFIWDWPWEQALGDLKRTGSHVSDGRGSNQWVVSASRSAEGGAIALIDPHLPWTPANRFYESHFHGGDLNFYGFSIVGTPLMVLGHTNVFSISATTGGPDCADIYEERINNINQYQYDGAWLDIQKETIEIEVLTDQGIEVQKHSIERTHHGPIIKRLGERAFVVKTAYDEQVGFADQLLKLLEAQNLGEFLWALSANQLLPQNIMYADIYGNSYYLRAGRVPIRSGDYHWDRPVPGWRSETEWQGIHPVSDLVQILNPGIGYMQNCNISPGTMMPHSPLQSEHYPTYIYNDEAKRTNTRGQRALQMLDADARLTKEEAQKIALDTYVVDSDKWQSALHAAFEEHGTAFVHLDQAVRLITHWDGRMDTDSPGASLFRFWMRACRDENASVPIAHIEEGETLGGGARRNLLKALEKASEDLQKSTGSIDPPWGDLHRGTRGEQAWPIGGLSADGIQTLRAVTSFPPDSHGVSYARGGQFCTTVVILDPNGIHSYSATPFGQSNDPTSAHYTDQGQLLYSKGRLKPTWYGSIDKLTRVVDKRIIKVPNTP